MNELETKISEKISSEILNSTGYKIDVSVAHVSEADREELNINFGNSYVESNDTADRLYITKRSVRCIGVILDTKNSGMLPMERYIEDAVIDAVNHFKKEHIVS